MDLNETYLEMVRNSTNVTVVVPCKTQIFSLPLIFIISFLSLTTIAGNAVATLSYKLNMKLQQPGNLCVVFLSLSGCVVGSFLMPVFATFTMADIWDWNLHTCAVWLFVDSLCIKMTIFGMIIMNFDRFFAVTKPEVYDDKRRHDRVYALLFVTAVLPKFFYASWFVHNNHSIDSGNRCHHGFYVTNPHEAIVLSLLSFYIPAGVVYFLSCRIRRHFRTQVVLRAFARTQFVNDTESVPMLPKGGEQAETTSPKKALPENTPKAATTVQRKLRIPPMIVPLNEDGDVPQLIKDYMEKGRKEWEEFGKLIWKTNRRWARQLELILWVYIITWFPHHLLVVIRGLASFVTDEVIVSETWLHLTYFFLYLSNTVNPAVYAIADPVFRKTYFKILTCKFASLSEWSIDHLTICHELENYFFDFVDIPYMMKGLILERRNHGETRNIPDECGKDGEEKRSDPHLKGYCPNETSSNFVEKRKDPDENQNNLDVIRMNPDKKRSDPDEKGRNPNETSISLDEKRNNLEGKQISIVKNRKDHEGKRSDPDEKGRNPNETSISLDGKRNNIKGKQNSLDEKRKDRNEKGNDPDGKRFNPKESRTSLDRKTDSGMMEIKNIAPAVNADSSVGEVQKECSATNDKVNKKIALAEKSSGSAEKVAQDRQIKRKLFQYWTFNYEEV